MNYIDNTIQAIETIVDQKIGAVTFDQTETCTIVSQDKYDVQKYWVSNGNMRFEAYSLNSEINYNPQSQVYVLIPKGDYNGRKVIIGEYSSQINAAETYTNPLNTMVSASSFKLLDNETLSNNNTKVVNINDLNISTGFGIYDYIGIEFSLQTNISNSSEGQQIPEYQLKFDLLDSQENTIIKNNYLIFSSKQIYGNPYQLNENFLFSHLFYFPELMDIIDTDIGTISKIRITLQGENLSTNDILQLHKCNIYFGYDKNNQALSKQAIMSINFPKISNAEIKMSYVSPPETVNEQYNNISESYKRKQLKLDWFVNSENIIINEADQIVSIDDTLKNYDIYWCQYLTKVPYSKLLDSDIDYIRDCYYKDNENIKWVDNNLYNQDETGFSNLYYKLSAKNSDNEIIKSIVETESLVDEHQGIVSAVALYYLNTENQVFPTEPTEEVTSVSTQANAWTTVCPITNAQGIIYTLIQITDKNNKVTWIKPDYQLNNIGEYTMIMQFATNVTFLVNEQWEYENKLLNNEILNTKLTNNNALFNEYKSIYNSEAAIFEANLLNKFKDILESGTYWQTVQKSNALDNNAYIYNLEIPIASSSREQNEEQVKAVIKNNKTGEYIVADGFIFQNITTVTDLPIDEQLNEINNNIVQSVEIEISRGTSYVQEPETWPNGTGNYLWLRQKLTNKNQQIIYGPSMCISNDNDINWETIQPLYYLQADGTDNPTIENENWSETCPSYEAKGQFWTCLRYTRGDNDVIYTSPIQAIINNSPKLDEVQFITISGSNPPDWQDTGWSTQYKTAAQGESAWQRTKTIYTNGIVRYSDAANITGIIGEDGKTPILMEKLYYLDTQQLTSSPSVNYDSTNDTEYSSDKWTKWQPPVPPKNKTDKYYTVFYYVYDDNTDGFGTVVIDEVLTATADTLNDAVVDTNIFFTRTKTNNPPTQIEDGTTEKNNQDNNIIIESNGITWYDDDANIPNKKDLSYLWQCIQTKTKSGYPKYSAPIFIKTKQSIEHIELYYLSSTDNAISPPASTTDIQETGNSMNIWYKSMPQWNTSAKCYYTCVQTKYDNGDITYTTPTKTQGTPVDVDIEFAINNSKATHPDDNTGEWTTDTPSTTSEKPFLWSRQKTTYGNNTVTYSGYTCVNLTDIKDIIELYYLTETETAPNKPTEKVTTTEDKINIWTTISPTYQKDYNYYACTQIEYLNGNVSWSEVHLANDKNYAYEAGNNASAATTEAEVAAEKAITAADAATDAANSVVQDINAFFTGTLTDTPPINPNTVGVTKNEDTDTITITQGDTSVIWYDDATKITTKYEYLWQIYKKTDGKGNNNYTNPVRVTTPAVVYLINSNANIISMSSDKTSINPETITLSCQKQLGSEAPVDFKCYWVVNNNGTAKATNTYSFDINANTTGVTVQAYLFYDKNTETYNTLLGQIYIPVIVGEAGKDFEFIYYRSTDMILDWEGIFDQTNKEANIQKGWTTSPQGIDANNQYEYFSYRAINSQGITTGWGDFVVEANVQNETENNNTSSSVEDGLFTIPALWAQWGFGVGITKVNELYYLEINTPPILPEASSQVNVNKNDIDIWTIIKPTFRNGGAYWTCLEHVYTDGTVTYTALTKQTEPMQISTTRISDLWKYVGTTLIDELEISLGENNPGIYNYYETSYQLEQSKRDARYAVEAKFLDTREDGGLNGKYYTITWEIPNTATMLKSIKNENLMNDDKDEYDEYSWDLTNNWSNKSLSYQLQQILSYNNINNTIWCKIVEYNDRNKTLINKVFVGYLKQDLKFGIKGSAGTEWRLNIISDKSILVPNESITLTATLHNSEGQEVESEDFASQLKWSWYSQDPHESNRYQLSSSKDNSVKITRNGILADPYAIIQVSLENCAISDKYSVSLNAYYPIISASESDYVLSGPTTIIYNREGSLESYDAETSYSILKNGTEIARPTFHLIDTEGNESKFFKINAKDNTIIPSAVLPNTPPQTAIAVKNNTGDIIYYQPLLIMRDVYYYKRNLINSWDGALATDEKNNAILAASFIAGRKESNNTFTGVLLGEVENDIYGGENGIYGMQKGNLRYKFTEHGEAYIGDGGNNYIEFKAKDSDFKNWYLKIRAKDLIVDTDNLDINTTATEVLNIKGEARIGNWYIKNSFFAYDLKENYYINETGKYHQTKMFLSTTGETILPWDGGYSYTYYDDDNKKQTIKGIRVAFKIGDDFGVTSSGTLYAKNGARIDGRLTNTDTRGNQVAIGDVGDDLVFSSTLEEVTNAAGVQCLDATSKFKLTLGVSQPAKLSDTNAAISYIYPYINPNDSTAGDRALYISSGYVDSSNRQSAYGATLILQAGCFQGSVSSPMTKFSRIQLKGNTYNGTKDNSEITFQSQHFVFSSSVSGDAKSCTAYCYGTWTFQNHTSDERLKYAIETYPEEYDTLFDALQPVRYKYYHGTSGRYHTGFIAQQVVSSLEASNLTTQDLAAVYLVDRKDVADTLGRIWSMRRDEFISLNTWQIQKLKTRVAELEQEIKEIKKHYEI